MKFFTKDMIEKHSVAFDCDMDGWYDICKQYDKMFALIRHKFSNRFLTIYNNNDRFHDFQLINIEYLPTKKLLKMVLSHDKYVYILVYSGVENFKLEPTDCTSNYNAIEWLYDEFEVTEGNMMRHSIMFVDFDFLEFEVVFKNIKVARRFYSDWVANYKTV